MQDTNRLQKMNFAEIKTLSEQAGAESNNKK